MTSSYPINSDQVILNIFVAPFHTHTHTKILPSCMCVTYHSAIVRATSATHRAVHPKCRATAKKCIVVDRQESAHQSAQSVRGERQRQPSAWSLGHCPTAATAPLARRHPAPHRDQCASSNHGGSGRSRQGCQQHQPSERRVQRRRVRRQATTSGSLSACSNVELPGSAGGQNITRLR